MILFIIIIFFSSPVELFGSKVNFSYETPINEVINAFISESFNTRCAVILYRNGQNWEESRETFKMTKHLMKIGKVFATISFQVYLECLLSGYCKDVFYYRYCKKTLAVVFGWQRKVEVALAEFSRQTEVSKHKWLIFLPHNVTAHTFLSNVNTPFDAEIVTATLKKDKVELEEGYRVAKNFPLRIVPYAIFDLNQRFMIMTRDDNLFKRRLDMEGFPIRASTVEHDPISGSYSISGELRIGGYFGEVNQELERLLNYTTIYVEAVEKAVGYNRNGVYNGILGMLQRDEIDFAVGPIFVDYDLYEIAGVFRPLFDTRTSIFFQPRENVFHWNDIFKPFGKYVWLFIIVFILIAAYSVNKFFYLECCYNHENPIYKKEYTKTNLFLIFLKSLCQQGNHLVPESNPCRMLYITWHFASTILLTAYSANLISLLANQVPKIPFTSLLAFLEDGTYDLVTIRKSMEYGDFLNRGDNSLFKRIFEKHMKHIPEDELPTDIMDGIYQICQNKSRAFYTIFYPSILIANSVSHKENCPIIHMQMAIIFLTIARKKYFPYSSLIDNQLQKMAEVGILSRFSRQMMRATTRNKVEFDAVTVDQIVQIHFVWIIGLGLALIILIFEMLFHNEKYRQSFWFKYFGKTRYHNGKFVEKYSGVIRVIENISYVVLIICIAIFIAYAL